MTKSELIDYIKLRAVFEQIDKKSAGHCEEIYDEICTLNEICEDMYEETINNPDKDFTLLHLKANKYLIQLRELLEDYTSRIAYLEEMQEYERNEDEERYYTRLEEERWYDDI